MDRQQVHIDRERTVVLKDICRALAEGRSVREMWPEAQFHAEAVTPGEVMYLVDYVIEITGDISAVKPVVSKMINLFSSSLKSWSKQQHQELPVFARELVEENRAIDDALQQLKELVTRIRKSGISFDREVLKHHINHLDLVYEHYIDKENILFSYIEKHVEHSRCLQLMWSIHDDVRSTLKQLRAYCRGEHELERQELNVLIGRLFFDVGSMVFREEHVLLPAVSTLLPPQVWEEMEISSRQGYEQQITGGGGGSIELPTGTLTAGELVQIFSFLPVDLTLVNADDEVVFFNTPEHRIFPRSTAVIGRNVRNCHPPESVHVVEKILTAFREKRQKEAEFYLHIQDAYVYIRYIALYTQEGEYDGVLEILQEISGLQNISGEKRLLSWD